MKQIVYQGGLISLYKQRVPYHGGHTDFDIVTHPGGAVIAAINQRNEICLLKQWRQAVQHWIWEFPAGCLEPSEQAEQTARRELQEEAGVIANSWQAMGEIWPSPGYSDERLVLFRASDLRQSEQKLDAAEKLEVHWFALDKVEQMAQNGEIKDAKTLALLMRLK